VGDAYRTLLLAQTQPDVLFDETILRHGLEQYTVLVLPEIRVLLKEVDERIRAFSERGGLVIADPAFKQSYPHMIRFDFTGLSMLNEETYQNALTRKAASLKEVLEKNRFVYPVKSTSHDVVLSTCQSGESKYIFVINDRRRKGEYLGPHGAILDAGMSQRATVSLDRRTFKDGALYDVLARRKRDLKHEDGRLITDVDLPPGGGSLLFWSPIPIERIQITAPPKARKGTQIVLDIAVTDNTNQRVPGAVPVQVTLRDGALRVNEYSGHYRTEKGRLSLTLPLAKNDVGGNWHITVKELIAVRSAHASFLVE